METANHIKILQMTYAGALADSVLRMGRTGVLEQVTAEKKLEQMQAGKKTAAQMGIVNPEDVFTRLAEVFNCAAWSIKQQERGFQAETSRCMLCAFAKELGAESPCRIYCLNPMEGMVKGLNPDLSFEVKETLWDGKKCLVEVKGKGY